VERYALRSALEAELATGPGAFRARLRYGRVVRLGYRLRRGRRGCAVGRCGFLSVHARIRGQRWRSRSGYHVRASGGGGYGSPSGSEMRRCPRAMRARCSRRPASVGACVWDEAGLGILWSCCRRGSTGTRITDESTDNGDRAQRHYDCSAGTHKYVTHTDTNLCSRCPSGGSGSVCRSPAEIQNGLIPHRALTRWRRGSRSIRWGSRFVCKDPSDTRLACSTAQRNDLRQKLTVGVTIARWHYSPSMRFHSSLVRRKRYQTKLFLLVWSI
jgi:hypothetical protein